MNAEVTSRTSETRSVSVPTGIKTLNRRIIEGAGRANGGKVNYTRDCGPSQRLDLNHQAYWDEDHLSRLSRNPAGGPAGVGSPALFLRAGGPPSGQRDGQLPGGRANGRCNTRE